MPDELKELERLIAVYHDAVRAYRRATDNLVDKHGEEFDRASEEADRLRLAAEDLRSKIRQVELGMRHHG